MTGTVFITGATGYLGRPLSTELISRGRSVRALAGPGSQRNLHPGCAPVTGDALRATTYQHEIAPARTLVHLVGRSHPAPWKERDFTAVALKSVEEAVAAAKRAGVSYTMPGAPQRS